jgi:hypothetical protein
MKGKEIVLGILVVLLLTACTQTSFIIDEEKFSQEAMAHAATLGTMYRNTDVNAGDHDCDDDPSTCCVAGYHFCDINEFLYGGREIEFSGTGRDADPYNLGGDVEVHAKTGSDCTGWDDGTGRIGTRVSCSYGTSASCSFNNACSENRAQWCCSR